MPENFRGIFLTHTVGADYIGLNGSNAKLTDDRAVYRLGINDHLLPALEPGQRVSH